LRRFAAVDRLKWRGRLQQVFFPDGVRFDGKELVGTGTTLPVFNYLNPVSEVKKVWWRRRESFFRVLLSHRKLREY
jgi:hypothetical protein